MAVDHAYWMEQALEQARKAEACGEVPVGAVIVRENRLVGEGYNQPVSGHDPSAHAEIVALRDAATGLENYRLPECDIYVTIEPCTMCMGALIHARIRHLYFGAREPRAGAVLSNLRLQEQGLFNHRVEVSEGLLQTQCSTLIREFFKRRR